MNHLLSWIIWLPVLGMVAIAFIPRDKTELIKQVSAATTGIQLALAIYLWRIFDVIWVAVATSLHKDK
jgi:NADH:ubiquinone oxidoreductase subunit 4 (subunit M)